MTELADEIKVFKLRPEADGDPTEASESQRCGDSLRGISTHLREFRAQRDWERFHTPRSLAISIAIEAGELLEQFQWMDETELTAHVEARREQICEELADVAIYVVQLSDVLGIDLANAIHRKIETNESRYPVETARGTSSKHSELSSDDSAAGAGA